jgi:cytochrome bd-type quinol oxidase subunit 1
MKISRQIWCFIGFALFTIFAYGAYEVWRLHSGLDQYSQQARVPVLLLYWALSLVGLTGMLYSLVAWLVAGVTRRLRPRQPH